MSPKLTLVAHCLLNPHARVMGIDGPKFDEFDGALYQLPCPELAYLGPLRWEVSREQLGFPGYRRFCDETAQRVAEDVECIAIGEQLEVRLVGVSKSPSCAVDITTVGYPGGRISNVKHEHVCGAGIFFSVLIERLKATGVDFKAEDAEI